MFESVADLNRPLGVGLIGFGGFGQFLADAFASMPQVRLCAISDADARRCELARQRFNALTFTNPYDLIECPEVEVVAIATPPSAHASLGIAAAQKAKSVFCEKPLATTLQDANQLVETARKHSAALIVDFVQRYNPLNERVRELVRRQALGRLVSIEVTNYASDEFLRPAHWFWDHSVSGGIWVEHGVHFFDLVAWWLGSSAQRVMAFSAQRPSGEQDRVWALVRYSEGHTAFFCHTFTQPAVFEQTTMRLAFSRGYIALHGWIPTRLYLRAMLSQSELEELEQQIGQKPTQWTVLPDETRSGWACGEAYQAQYVAEFDLELSEGKQAVYQRCVKRAMLDLVEMTRRPDFTPRVTAQDGLHALQTALAAARSADGATPIFL